MATMCARACAVATAVQDDQGWGDVGYNPTTYQNDAYKYNWTFNPPRMCVPASRAAESLAPGTARLTHGHDLRRPAAALPLAEGAPRGARQHSVTADAD